MSGAALASHTAIYRCAGEDDVPIYSDRTCGALGISDRRKEADRPEILVLPSSQYDCSRRIDTLQDWVRVALESGDVNQLAGLYHWMDTTAESADMLMSELQVISGQRLAGIEVQPSEFDGGEHPARLWLEQYDPERPGQTFRTGFNLVMNSGCWWLHWR